MSTPFFQPLDPAGAPDPVTPQDSPSSPEGWAKVTPAGIGGAPYDISAPQDIAGIAAAAQAARELSGGAEGVGPGAGLANVAGPRQAEARQILESPQGADSSNVFAGFPDYESADLRPGADLETPIQGHGFHPGTTQDGISQFTAGLGAGVEGVQPEGGSMGGGAGLGYPGTTQDGVTKYGTS